VEDLGASQRNSPGGYLDNISASQDRTNRVQALLDSLRWLGASRRQPVGLAGQLPAPGADS
jgi:hypothetical protein